MRTPATEARATHEVRREKRPGAACFHRSSTASSWPPILSDAPPNGLPDPLSVGYPAVTAGTLAAGGRADHAVANSLNRSTAWPWPEDRDVEALLRKADQAGPCIGSV